jgi:hypothetical protein
MNVHETRRYEMLVRVREFGVARADLFPPTSLAAGMFADVSAAVAAFREQAAAQISGRGAARESTSAKAAARRALHDRLDAIRRTARGITLDTPGLDQRFRRPSGQGDVALLSAARAVGQEAVPLADQFIARGMPPAFLADLAADIEHLEEAIRARNAGRQTHIIARASIKAAIDAGFAAVRRLDATVPNLLHADPVALAAWHTARRVEWWQHARRTAPIGPDPGPPGQP